jgi:hypothetical protein
MIVMEPRSTEEDQDQVSVTIADDYTSRMAADSWPSDRRVW